MLLPESLNARLNGDTPRFDASTLAQRLAGMIGEARSIARKHELARMDFEKGLFAVLAWADETLLSGDWPGAAEWQRHLLQLRYFNSITAGVEFFTILDTLGPEQKDLREVFALCLCLGFKGRFASERTLRGLEEKRRTVIEQVMATAGLPEESRHLLFPDAYGTRRSFAQRASRLVNSLRRLRRAPGRPSNETLTLIGAPLLLLIVLYVTYSAIVGNMIGALVAQIK